MNLRNGLLKPKAGSLKEPQRYKQYGRQAISSRSSRDGIEILVECVIVGGCVMFCYRDHGSPSRQDHLNFRTVVVVQDMKSQMLDGFDHQARMRTNAMLAVVETVRTENTEVIGMLSHMSVQTRSQVEPDGSTSLTTRVRRRLLATTSLTHIDRSTLHPR